MRYVETFYGCFFFSLSIIREKSGVPGGGMSRGTFRTPHFRRNRKKTCIQSFEISHSIRAQVLDSSSKTRCVKSRARALECTNVHETPNYLLIVCYLPFSCALKLALTAWDQLFELGNETMYTCSLDYLATSKVV